MAWTALALLRFGKLDERYPRQQGTGRGAGRHHSGRRLPKQGKGSIGSSLAGAGRDFVAILASIPPIMVS